MKILVCHNTYLHQGGEDAVVQSEVGLLRQHNDDVIFYQRSNAELSGLNKFAVHSLLWSKRTYQELAELIDRERPDVAHFHNPFFMLSPSAYQVCCDKKVPIVQTLHNYRFLCLKGVLHRNGEICEECLSKNQRAAVKHRCLHDSFAKSLIGISILNAYQKHNVLKSKVKLFIAPSEFCKDIYCRHAEIDEKKICVKPHFIEDPGVSEEQGSYALYVGALRDYKGIHVLLDAWKRVEGLPLKIIGKVIAPFDSFVQDKVELLGEKSFDETIDMIKGAAFVVIPSLCYETFARVIIEAYACGKPVIASGIGAIKERVIPGKTGFLFEPARSENLFEKVEELVQNAEQARAMGSNARLIYEEQYTARHNYETLMKIYQKAASL